MFVKPTTYNLRPITYDLNMLIQLLIIQIITFVAFLFVLRVIFTRNLNVALERLNVLNEENIAKEAQLTEELKRAQKERDAEVVKGKAEAAVLIDEAKQEAIKTRLKLEEEARAQAEKIVSQGRAEAEELKEKLGKEVRERGLEFAVKIIEEVFTEKNKDVLQRQFISEIIEEIANLPKTSFNVSSDKVRVTSSYPLEELQRADLIKVLTEKTGSKPALEEVINKDLICGLLLEIGGLAIDGTLKNKLYRILPEFKK